MSFDLIQELGKEHDGHASSVVSETWVCFAVGTEWWEREEFFSPEQKYHAQDMFPG